MIGPLLFTWLQGADFYRSFHREALDLLPPEEGQIWVDVGCGPGLMVRLAAGDGYQATGWDLRPSMVWTARRLAGTSPARFRVGGVEDLPPEVADVVSASSLLAVLPDRAAGLQHLWRAVRPGGHLLVLEATTRLTRAEARRLIRRGGLGSRAEGLWIWARAREGRTVDLDVFEVLRPSEQRRVSLVEGCVEARLLQKPF